MNKFNLSDNKIINIAEIVIKRFIKNGSIEYEYFDEMKQSVLEKYYTKKHSIEAAFNDKAKPETYVSAILYRMVLEILRKEDNRIRQERKMEDNSFFDDDINNISPEHQLIINNEIDLLKRVFVTLGKNYEKQILFLKIFYRINISSKDWQSYDKDFIYAELFDKIHQSKELKEKEIWTILTDLSNGIENKNTGKDAVRISVNKSINQIINRLNGQFNRTYYNKETLGVLFELAFNKNQTNEHKIKSINQFLMMIV